jgi:hypothetical protein
MDVVLVHWRIRSDALDQLQADFPTLAIDTPGFLGEELYQRVGSSGAVTELVRIGRWANEADFYMALGIRPGQVPSPKDYELNPRRREWLRFVRDDLPTRAVD